MPAPVPGMDPFLEHPESCSHHFDQWEDYFVYPWRLPEPLPEIAIPLLPGDPPVPLDLQIVFQRTYDAGPYPREIDYRQDVLVPPLSPSQQEWAPRGTWPGQRRAVGEPQKME